MRDLFFDIPWWLPTAFALAGIGLFLSGNKRQQVTARNAGIGLVLVGIILAAISYFGMTDEEKVLRRTSELVASLDKQDWPKFESLLDEQTSLGRYTGRANMVRGAQHAVQRFGLKKVQILSREVRHTGTLMTVILTVYSEQEMPGPMTTSWELDWQQRGEEWFLYKVGNLGRDGQPDSSFMRHLPFR